MVNYASIFAQSDKRSVRRNTNHGVEIMPIITFDSKESIPEGFETGDIKETDDGKFTVNVVTKAKLDEFREKNISQSKGLEAVSAKLSNYVSTYGEIEDFEEAGKELETMRETAQRVEDGKLKQSGDVEAEIEKRTKSMKGDFERRLQESEKARAAAEAKAKETEGKFRSTIVDHHVTAAIIRPDSGVNQDALPDILNRARSVFRVNDDGKLVAMDGDAVIYGADGATPMTPAEWLGQLKESAPYFFKGSTGGDAGGNDGKGGKATKKYGGMSEEEFNKLPAAKKLAIANQGV